MAAVSYAVGQTAQLHRRRSLTTKRAADQHFNKAGATLINRNFVVGIDDGHRNGRFGDLQV